MQKVLFFFFNKKGHIKGRKGAYQSHFQNNEDQFLGHLSDLWWLHAIFNMLVIIFYMKVKKKRAKDER